MNLIKYPSWGRFPQSRPATIAPLAWRSAALPPTQTDSILAYGLGRSYGDVCLNNAQTLLPTRGLRRFIHFEAKAGILRCEAGVSLAEILELVVPQGWFLPVTPGSKFVTVGGALANDVHGKNHHRAGTFGRHVLQFELLRSDGARLLCSPSSHPDLYAATIGGLGLTGVITWAEIQLKPICHRAIQSESIQFENVEEFFSLSAESDRDYEYTMAWVDCNAENERLGRGIFYRGNHVTEAEAPAKWTLPLLQRLPSVLRTMPLDLPGFTLNKWSVRAFNHRYYHKLKQKQVSELVDYDPFFYPLDAILQWNRLYGKAGFLQYQFVVPDEDKQIIRAILQRIAASGMSSFLAVLKTFGDITSPGLLSFPRKGVTLALDFPNKGAATFALLDSLDAQVREAGGAVYPCKDARMSARSFQTYYPQWQTFAAHIDPQFSSSFWRRVTQET